MTNLDINTTINMQMLIIGLYSIRCPVKRSHSMKVKWIEEKYIEFFCPKCQAYKAISIALLNEDMKKYIEDRKGNG